MKNPVVLNHVSYRIDRFRKTEVILEFRSCDPDIPGAISESDAMEKIEELERELGFQVEEGMNP